MSGAADQKDAILPVLLGDEIVDLPLGYLLDLIFHGAIANGGLDLLPNPELRDVAPGEIVPKEERIPFIPGIDARPYAKRHLASGMIGEGQCTGTVPYILGQIRLQPDTYGVSNRSFALEIDLHLTRYYAATAVGPTTYLARI